MFRLVLLLLAAYKKRASGGTCQSVSACNTPRVQGYLPCFAEAPSGVEEAVEGPGGPHNALFVVWGISRLGGRVPQSCAFFAQGWDSQRAPLY